MDPNLEDMTSGHKHEKAPRPTGSTPSVSAGGSEAEPHSRSADESPLGGEHSHSDDHGHSHDDGHHHPHGDDSRWAGIKHGLSDLFGMHSHDPADSVDSALESSARGIRALGISFSVLIVTAIIQAVLVWYTGSVSLLADTIHNFSDALTAVPLFIAFRLGRRAVNRRYTYGYRRAEDLAGLFVVLMILLSAIVVLWESVGRLFDPRELEHLGVLFAAGIVGFLGNEMVALYRIRIGREIGSAALVADGRHARADGFTSLAVAASAVGVWLGFELADPIVGIIVGIVILRVMWSAAGDIYGRLMDAVDPELVDQIERVAASVDGVLSVPTCQVRWMGHRLRADISIGVGSTLSVGDGHEIGEHVRRTLQRDVRHLDTVFVHIDSDATTIATSSSQEIM